LGRVLDHDRTVLRRQARDLLPRHWDSVERRYDDDHRASIESASERFEIR
jgi:hypothetical protein